MTSRIAIIAGAGRFPLYVAQAAKRQGVGVVAVGIKGWVDPALAGSVEAYEELAVGQLGALIAYLKSQRIAQAIMAGKVTKDVLLDARTTFDADAWGVLQQAGDRSVAAVLGAIGARLASEGIVLLDSSAFLKDLVCPVGVLTTRSPSAAESADIQTGVQAARALADLDVGQTLIVKGQVIVAVEALEGTDAAIRRAHALAGAGLVVVKVASRNQDRRFDLPVIGTDTMATLRETGVSCVAIEAGTTLVLERDTLVAAANAAGICVIGVEL